MPLVPLMATMKRAHGEKDAHRGYPGKIHPEWVCMFALGRSMLLVAEDGPPTTAAKQVEVPAHFRERIAR
jgi:hypothetical protein